MIVISLECHRIAFAHTTMGGQLLRVHLLVRRQGVRSAESLWRPLEAPGRREYCVFLTTNLNLSCCCGCCVHNNTERMCLYRLELVPFVDFVFSWEEDGDERPL